MLYHLHWKMTDGEERTRTYSNVTDMDEAIDIILMRSDVDKTSVYFEVNGKITQVNR